MKILYFSDPHNSDTPPRMRTASYKEDILAKQAALIEPAKACDMVICGGDVYHQKKPEKISHRLVNELCEIYREFPNMWILAGNHDYDVQPEELRYNPLATLGKLPNICVGVASFRALKSGISLCLLGLGEYHSFDYIKKFLADWKRNRGSIYSIAVIHAAVSSKKYPFPVLDFKEIVEYADLFLLGHIHDFQKVGHHGTLVAPGGLSRGVLRVDESLNRKVGYCIIDIDLGSRNCLADFIPLPVKSVDEVFKMEQKGDEARTRTIVSDFIDYIQHVAVPKCLSKEALIAHIKKQEVGDDVKAEAIRILEEL